MLSPCSPCGDAFLWVVYEWSLPTKVCVGKQPCQHACPPVCTHPCVYHASTGGYEWQSQAAGLESSLPGPQPRSAVILGY